MNFKKNMKIIQIIDLQNNRLLGLGDDGTTYVSVENQYGIFWVEYIPHHNFMTVEDKKYMSLKMLRKYH